MNKTQRDKKFTEELKKMSYVTRLIGEEKRLARMLALVLLEDAHFSTPDQPGCEDMKISNSLRGLGGFDLNYPRTIELTFSNGSLNVQFGLSGAVYPCSDEEVRFARAVIGTFGDIERAFNSETLPDPKNVGTALATFNRFQKLSLDPKRTAELVARVAESEDQTVQYLTVKVSELL